MIRQFAPIGIAALLILGGMLYQGKHTERWGDLNSELLAEFTENLKTVPPTFGNWTSEEAPLSPDEFKRTDCTGYISRNYANDLTGDTVSLYSVVGTARHVTIHSPDWCYVGAGFTMEGDPHPYNIDVDGTLQEFTTATFVKSTAEGTKRLRIFWAYTDDGQWHGPAAPKAFFAGRPALCKIYLITNIDLEDDDIDANPSIQFAKEFIPIMNKELLRKPESTTDSDLSDISS